MAENTNTPKAPGEFVTLHFPITASVILFLLVILVTLIYALKPEWRGTMNFAGAALAVAAGALSAYYLGKGLAQTVRQRNEQLHADRVARAFELISRWNDPELANSKHEFRQIIESGQAHMADQLDESLNNEPAKRAIVIEVLNFFEQIALAANCGYANDDTLRKYYRGSVSKYHSTLEAWIKKHRAIKNRPAMYIELEEMVKRWGKS